MYLLGTRWRQHHSQAAHWKHEKIVNHQIHSYTSWHKRSKCSNRSTCRGVPWVRRCTRPHSISWSRRTVNQSVGNRRGAATRRGNHTSWLKNLSPLTLELEGWIRVGGGIFELQAGGPAALAATLISNRCWREAASLSPSSLVPPAAYLAPLSQPPRVAYYIRPESEDGKFGKIRKLVAINFLCF